MVRLCHPPEKIYRDDEKKYSGIKSVEHVNRQIQRICSKSRELGRYIAILMRTANKYCTSPGKVFLFI